jgi:hypothetical protein
MSDKHPAQLTEVDAIKNFVLGGKAKFTLVSQRTGTRYTFKVAAADERSVHFVSTLYGPDNEADYSYLGIIGTKGDFIITKKSNFTYDSPQAKAFGWLWNALPNSSLPGEQLRPGVEFWHEGCCCRCGRTLTVPSSIAAGIGPECATKGF